MKIVRTSNDGGDYPDEEIINLPSMNERTAEKITRVLNKYLSGPDPYIWPDFYKVVPNDYGIRRRLSLSSLLYSVGLYGAGMVAAINLSRLLPTNPTYSASWVKVVLSVVYAIIISLYLARKVND